ncbi:MAG TPA: hypothetical protein VK707_06405 [Solirubrobacteraceae bacterium]|jgi:hypothetical protein|nr:hypothetical protein [Solirubrobacteraceae bacterium]
MPVFGCLTHWYESMMYVVPVLAVGGWGWWSARRMKNDRKGGGGGDAPKPPLGSTAGSPASH